MATPKDHIDMKKRTKATALATHVIWFHRSMILSPPSIVLSSDVCYDPGDVLYWIYCSVNWTVTVMMTGTGTPLRVVGVNSHCRTASSAAWSSNGIDRSTFASATLPFGPMVAS